MRPVLALSWLLYVAAATRSIPDGLASAGLSRGRRGNVLLRSDDSPPLEVIVERQSQLIEEQRAALQAVRADLQQLRQDFANSQQMVVFMVSAPDDMDVVREPRLHFGNPDINIGDGFHTATDSFVAPVSGVYVFFLKVSAAAENQPGYGTFSVKREGHVIAETETNDADNIDRSSVQVITQLTSGQSVWVDKTAGGVRTVSGGGVHTTFGGYLLRAADALPA